MKCALRIGNQYYTMQVLIDASLEDWKYGRTEGWKVGFPLSHIPSRFMCGAARVLLSLMGGCAKSHLCGCARVLLSHVCGNAYGARICCERIYPRGGRYSTETKKQLRISLTTAIAIPMLTTTDTYSSIRAFSDSYAAMTGARSSWKNSAARMPSISALTIPPF